MAKLRKAKAYRRIKRAYTRKSKFKNQSYIPTVPPHKIIRFDMGDPKKKYKYKLKIVSLNDIQIRHNAIESIRQIINRKLQQRLGSNYHFKINKYPHHVLRENKMLTGAGADRMQSGMKHAFGKAVGTAIQTKKGETIFTISVNNEEGLKLAKNSFKSAFSRLPGKCTIQIEKINSLPSQSKVQK